MISNLIQMIENMLASFMVLLSFLDQIAYPTFFAILTYLLISKYTSIKSLKWLPLNNHFLCWDPLSNKIFWFNPEFFKDKDKIEKINSALCF